MNEIEYFSSLTETVPQRRSWETVATEIRTSDSLADLCRRYRTLLASNDKAAMKAIKTKCPAIMPQVTLDGGRASANITGYLPYMIIDIDHIPAERMQTVEKQVKDDEHTRLAYVTISGLGMRVIAEVEGEVTYENYRDAWLSANEYYKRLTGLDYDLQCSNPTRMCGLSFDPKVVYRPTPKRIKIKKRPAKRKGAGRPCHAKTVAQKVRKTVEGDGAAYTDGRHNDYVARCIYLMNRYGVRQDDCLEWALGEFADYAETHPGTVQGIVKSVYSTQAADHGTLSASSRGEKKKKASVAEVEAYISKHYRLRLNRLSLRIEIQNIHDNNDSDKNGSADSADDHKTWVALDDHAVNSIWRRMQNEHVSTDVMTINNIIASDYSRDYYPFHEWIQGLPEWDGKTNYIRQFFSLVHCMGTPEELFHFYTRCWFLAMVASVLDDDVVNHEILTFIGKQGTYKSSFMLHILPPHLRQFYSTKNNFSQVTKDDKLMLASNIIIGLEEIDTMTTKEVNILKAYVTEPKVNERPPYARHTMLLPRVASLTATGNNLTFLTDQTGNRRWLPFHVVSIDNPWDADIPYEGMYAQALSLIRSGERFWLNDADIRRLNERNKEFMAPDPAEEMIVTRFMHPRSEAETKYMTASRIAEYFAPQMKISPTKIGIAMTNLGFQQERHTSGRFWLVAERPQSEIDSSVPDVDHSHKDEEKDMPF